MKNGSSDMPVDSSLQVIRDLFSDAADPVLLLDASGRVLFASRGSAPRWTEGQVVAPESGFGRAVLPLLSPQQGQRIEWSEPAPDGSSAWYTCSVSPHRAGDGPGSWLCICTDISDLKRSEERLRRSEQLMVDTQGVAHLGTWEWDLSEPHAYWSSELYRIYGLTPDAYTPSYERYLEMVHPDDRQRVIDATNRVFHEHVPYSHDERIFRPDGTMRYLHTWAYPVLDAGGKLRRLVGVCQDITDRAEAEEKIRRLNLELEHRVAERTSQLEKAMRDLEAFNAMVGHDLRAPLHTISLATSLIAETAARAESPQLTRGVERIGRAIAQMTGLIDSLLAFARIRDVSVQWAKLDLSALAQEIVADLRQGSPDRPVEVSIEEGITCFGDRELMRVALQNLLGNAWKYTARVSPARVWVTSTPISGRRVLAIRDNGAGFDMKDAHRLFAPFQRLHSDREFAGTGMGLASVQRILDRHGARIWAESVPAQGSSFFFELPEAGAEPMQPSTAAPDGQRTTAAPRQS